MSKIVTGRGIKIITLSIILLAIFCRFKETGYAQMIMEPGNPSALPGLQMFTSSQSLLSGGGLASFITPDLASSIGFSPLTAALALSSIMGGGIGSHVGLSSSMMADPSGLSAGGLSLGGGMGGGVFTSPMGSLINSAFFGLPFSGAMGLPLSSLTLGGGMSALGGSGLNPSPFGLPFMSAFSSLPMNANSWSGFYPGTLMNGASSGQNSYFSPFSMGGYSSMPSYGMSSYGMSSYGMSSYGMSSYGMPSYGMSSYGMPSYGMSPYGMSPYGMSPYMGGSNTGMMYSPFNTTYGAGSSPLGIGNYGSGYGSTLDPRYAAGSYGYSGSLGGYTGSTGYTSFPSTYLYNSGFLFPYPYGYQSQGILGGTLEGKITGMDETTGRIQFLGGASITVSLNGTTYLKEAFSGTGGYYVIGVASEGPYTVEVFKEGYDLYTEIIYISLGTSKNFELEWPRQLQGMVKDKGTGQALVNVTVKARSLTDPTLPDRATTSNTDGYYFLNVPKGRYYVWANYYPVLGGSAADSTKVEVTALSGDIFEQDISCNLPEFSGTIEDESGNVIDGAVVSISITPSLSALYLPLYRPSPILPNHGKFRVPLASTSSTYTYKIKVTADGYEDKTISSLSIPSGGRKNYTIVLDLEPSVNQPPVIDPPIGDITIEAGQVLSFTVGVKDTDSTIFSYEIKGPSTLNWPTSYTKDYLYTTGLADVGENIVGIKVSDDSGNQTTAQVRVKVIYRTQLILKQGINVISYPVEPNDSAFDLLPALGTPSQVKYLIRYNYEDNQYEEAFYNINGSTVTLGGVDFPTSREDGYLIYANQPMTINLEIDSGNLTSCDYYLHQGINLIGMSIILSDEYSAFDLLLDLGEDSVNSLYRYNPATGQYEYSYWMGDYLSGVDFPIRMGEGYFIQMKIDKQLSLPVLR